MGKYDPGRTVTERFADKFLKIFSSEYLRWGGGWQRASGPKTLFGFDL